MLGSNAKAMDILPPQGRDQVSIHFLILVYLSQARVELENKTGSCAS